MLLNTTRNFLISENEDMGNARVILLGVPFDTTETTLPGQRLAPLEIRKALLSMDMSEKIIDGLYDAGDVVVVHGSVQKTMEALEDALEEIWKKNSSAKILVLGGEHTITYGVVKFLASKLDVLQLVFMDAHGDAYDEYVGLKLSHATVLRRIAELENIKIAAVGVREEMHGLKKLKLVELGELDAEMPTYISLDVDVLDPSIMPGVADPVPAGLKVEDVASIIKRFKNLVGMDVVELNPLVESHVSSRTVAWIIREFLKQIVSG